MGEENKKFINVEGKVFVSSNFTLPDDMVFGDVEFYFIITYCILFLFGFIMNIMSFYQLIRERVKKKIRSRMNLLLVNLAVADLVVILFQLPIEIAWTYTLFWEASELMCRLMAFLRMVGFYLSGFIMMVISIDRLMAIMSPMEHRLKRRRTRVMLVVAWVSAPLFTLPQTFNYQLTHPYAPLRPEFAQCRNNAYPYEKMAYLVVFLLFSVWMVPLLVMIGSYLGIIIVLLRRSSELGSIGRAKIRTVKITGILVLGYIFCWTPYNVRLIWWLIHKDDCEKHQTHCHNDGVNDFMTNYQVRRLFFSMGCVNNCLNPLLYRMIGFDCWRSCKKSSQATSPPKMVSTQTSGTSVSSGISILG